MSNSSFVSFKVVTRLAKLVSISVKELELLLYHNHFAFVSFNLVQPLAKMESISVKELEL